MGQTDIQDSAKGIGKPIAWLLQKPKNFLDMLSEPFGNFIYNRAVDCSIEYKNGKYILNEQKLKENLENTQAVLEFIAIEGPNIKISGTIDGMTNSLLSKLKSDPKMKANPQTQLLLENKKAGQLLIGYNTERFGVGNPVKIAGNGSSGRTLPKNLKEQMVMSEVKSNPLEGATDLSAKGMKLGDPRWPAKDGWVKFSKDVDGVQIHFNYNKITKEFDDFKFKDLD